jgi:hypothetical protein
VLKLIPWNGEPINKHNPTGPVRTLPFGAAGEDQRRADVITVVWAG